MMGWDPYHTVAAQDVHIESIICLAIYIFVQGIYNQVIQNVSNPDLA